jgi:beta-galactosidase
VTLKDLNGKMVKKINGGKFTILPNEMKLISASAIVKNLNFWSRGFGYLYDVKNHAKD